MDFAERELTLQKSFVVSPSSAQQLTWLKGNRTLNIKVKGKANSEVNSHSTYIPHLTITFLPLFLAITPIHEWASTGIHTLYTLRSVKGTSWCTLTTKSYSIWLSALWRHIAYLFLSESTTSAHINNLWTVSDTLHYLADERNQLTSNISSFWHNWLKHIVETYLRGQEMKGWIRGNK